MNRIPVRRRRRALAVALSLALALAALTVAGCDDGASSDQLIVSGSTTILPIAEVSRERFEQTHPDIKVLVAGVGSSAGIESVVTGTADIGTSSRELKDEEKSLGLVDTPIARDAIAVIVHPANPVKKLTTTQVAAIFRGEITNWSQVGGADVEIGLVNRDEASGTREAFSKIVLGGEPFDPTAAVLPGTGQVRSVVAKSPGAVGYISVGFVDSTVRAIEIDGVAPTEHEIAAGRYPISRVLHFFTKGEPEGLAASYIEFVLSDDVQDGVVRDAGFLPIRAVQ